MFDGRLDTLLTEFEVSKPKGFRDVDRFRVDAGHVGFYIKIYLRLERSPHVPNLKSLAQMVTEI